MAKGPPRKARIAAIRSVVPDPSRPVSPVGLLKTWVHEKRLRRAMTIDRLAFALFGVAATMFVLLEMPPSLGVQIDANSPVLWAVLPAIVFGLAAHIVSCAIFAKAIDLPEEVMAKVMVEYDDA